MDLRALAEPYGYALLAPPGDQEEMVLQCNEDRQLEFVAIDNLTGVGSLVKNQRCYEGMLRKGVEQMHGMIFMLEVR